MSTPKKRKDIIAYLPLAWYFFEEEKEKTVGGLCQNLPGGAQSFVFYSQIMKE